MPAAEKFVIASSKGVVAMALGGVLSIPLSIVALIVFGFADWISGAATAWSEGTFDTKKAMTGMMGKVRKWIVIGTLNLLLLVLSHESSGMVEGLTIDPIWLQRAGSSLCVWFCVKEFLSICENAREKDKNLFPDWFKKGMAKFDSDTTQSDPDKKGA